MKSLNKYLTIESLLSLLILVSFFMPWVDMALFVKVVGWDIPFVQDELAKFSTKIPSNDGFNAIFGLYILPIISILTIILSSIQKEKTAKIFLTVNSVLSLIACGAVIYFIPNIGTGIYFLITCAILAILYLIYTSIGKK